MDAAGTQMQKAADENANSVAGKKQPLTKKSSLLPAVKRQLEMALNDMKKSVVNLRKSPWLLSRSSSYIHSYLL